MAEPKPLASLTSGLLARKGAAQPAMRRPMLGFGRSALAVQQDDLGWNDMGFDPQPIPVPAPAEDVIEIAPMPIAPVPIGLTPMVAVVPLSADPPPVVTERQELAERLGASVETVKPKAKKAAPVASVSADPKRKAAFTLRLDPDRHLKLRLACAITGRSAQQIVSGALDEFLNDLPEIDRLTQQLPHMRGDK